MADTGDILRKLVLELETVINDSKSKEFFGRLITGLKKSEDALRKHDVAVKKIDTSWKKFFKSGEQTIKAMKASVTTITAITGAFAGLLLSIKPVLQNMADLGATFNKFAVTTAGGQRAVQNLIGVYSEMNKSSKTAVLDIREIADAVGKYAAMGFLEFASSAEKNVIGGIAKMTSAMKRLGQPEAIMNAMKELGQKGGDAAVVAFTEAWGKLGEFDYAGQLKLMTENMANLGEAGFHAAAAIRVLMDAQRGIGEPIAIFSVKWNTAMASLEATFKKLQNALAQALGDNAIALVDAFTAAIGQLSDSVTGNAAVVTTLKNVMAQVFAVLTTVIQSVTDAVKWWMNLSDATKTLFEGIGLVIGALVVLKGLMVVDAFVGMIKVLQGMYAAFTTITAAIWGATAAESAWIAVATVGVGLAVVAVAIAASVALVHKLKSGMADATKEAQKYGQETKKQVPVLSEAERIKQAQADADEKAYMQLTKLTAEAQSFTRNLQNAEKSSSAYAKTLAIAGSIPGLEGKQRQARETINTYATEIYRKNAEAQVEISALLAREKKNLDDARAAGDQKGVEKAERNRAGLMEKQAAAQEEFVKSYQSLKTSIEAAGAGEERRLQIAESQIAVTAANKAALESVAGVPGLTIEATRQHVKALGEAVSATQAQLGKVREAYSSSINKAQEAYNKAQAEAAENIKDQEEQTRRQIRLEQALVTLEGLKKDAGLKENELRAKILQQTTQQMQAQKELRAGYLDAIGAMALGAGKFEKFLVTQERNKRRGMQLGMVNTQAAGGLLGGINAGPSAAPTQWGAQFGVQRNLVTGADMKSSDWQNAWSEQSKGQEKQTAAIGQSAVDIQKTIMETAAAGRAAFDRFINAGVAQGNRALPGAKGMIDVPGGAFKNAPRMAGGSGGPLPGPAGTPIPIIAHAGETITPAYNEPRENRIRRANEEFQKDQAYRKAEEDKKYSRVSGHHYQDYVKEHGVMPGAGHFSSPMKAAEERDKKYGGSGWKSLSDQDKASGHYNQDIENARLKTRMFGEKDWGGRDAREKDKAAYEAAGGKNWKSLQEQQRNAESSGHYFEDEQNKKEEGYGYWTKPTNLMELRAEAKAKDREQRAITQRSIDSRKVAAVPQAADILAAGGSDAGALRAQIAQSVGAGTPQAAAMPSSAGGGGAGAAAASTASPTVASSSELAAYLRAAADNLDKAAAACGETGGGKPQRNVSA